MALAFLIYAISILHSIYTFCMLLGISLILLGGGILLNSYLNMQKYKGKAPYIFAVFGVILMAISAIIPTEKTAWYMVGGYAAQTAYESEYGESLKKIVKNKLNEMIEQDAKNK